MSYLTPFVLAILAWHWLVLLGRLISPAHVSALGKFLVQSVAFPLLAPIHLLFNLVGLCEDRVCDNPYCVYFVHSLFLLFIMTSSSSTSFSFPPGALTQLRALLADKTAAYRELSSSDIQLTQRYPLLSDIPISQQTPSLIRFYSLINRTLIHIHDSNLPPIPSLSFYAMSSSSFPSPPSPLHSSSSSSEPSPTTAPPLPSVVSDSPDPRTLRRLRRQNPQPPLLSHSTPPSTNSPLSRVATPLFSSLPQSTTQYPSPPLLPQRLPSVIPSPLTFPPPPSNSSSVPTMAHFSHSASPSSFSFSTPPPARLDTTSSPVTPTVSSTTFPIQNSSSPPLPPPSTPNYPSLSSQPPLFPLHQSHHSVSPPTPFDILQPDPSHITTDEIQHETHTSGILRTEFTNFPRIPDNQLTERLVTSLLERIAKQLSIDSSHNQNCREAQCIRMLRTSFHWRRLALWLRTYTDKSIHLSYPRTEYWTRLYDQNVHYCHQQQPEQLDLATALQRLTQNLTRSSLSPSSSTMTSFPTRFSSNSYSPPFPQRTYPHTTSSPNIRFRYPPQLNRYPAPRYPPRQFPSSFSSPHRDYPSSSSSHYSSRFANSPLQRPYQSSPTFLRFLLDPLLFRPCLLHLHLPRHIALLLFIPLHVLLHLRLLLFIDVLFHAMPPICIRHSHLMYNLMTPLLLHLYYLPP